MKYVKEIVDKVFCYLLQGLFILILIIDILLFPGIIIYTVVNVVNYGWEFITLAYIGKMVGIVVAMSFLTSAIALPMLYYCTD